MYGQKEYIAAGRVTKVVKLTSLSNDYNPGGNVFSVFLAPKEGSDAGVGDVLAFDAMLPDSNGEFVEVPVVVGDWSPIVFRAIKASAIDLTDFDVYVAPIRELVL